MNDLEYSELSREELISIIKFLSELNDEYVSKIKELTEQAKLPF
jgi:uncharacterized protein YktA (UPF0223 family)